MAALSKQVTKDLADDTKTLDEMEANTNMYAGDIQTWKGKVEESLSKSEEKLGDVDRKLRDDMADAMDKFEKKKGNIQKNVRFEVAAMKRTVLNDLDTKSQETIDSAREKAKETETTIKKGVDDSMGAIDTITSETNQLGAQMSQQRSKLNGMMSNLGNIEETSEREGEAVQETISQTQAKTLADIEDYKGEYSTLFEKKKVKMEDTAKKLESDNAAALDVLKSTLNTKVTNMKSDAERLLAKTKNDVATNQRQTTQMISTLQGAVKGKDGTNSKFLSQNEDSDVNFRRIK